MQDLVGRVILNQFRIDAFIASGGMGAVYRVWDLHRNVPLAMKILHEDLAEDPSIYKRFQREARALKRLAHPNIVPFYGLFKTDDFFFLLERYVDGPSLKQILRNRRGKSLPVDEVLIYLKAICGALGYAHAHGVVHCDIKPGNVMVDRGGAIYLTDFGVARHAESTMTSLGVAGTAAYMAPEQCRGDPVNARTDVYALGVMLYEMLTGRRPFLGDEEGTESEGTTAAERVRFAHLHLTPPNPKLLNPRIPDPLAQIILKALEKNPLDRYSGVWEFYQAVCEAVALDPDLVGERSQVPEALIQSPPIQSEGPVRRRGSSLGEVRNLPWLQDKTKVSISLGLLGVFVIVLFFLFGKPSTPLSPEAQTVLVTATSEATTPAARMKATVMEKIAEKSETQLPQKGISVKGPTETPTVMEQPTETSSPLPGSINGGDGAPMVLIPSGTFIMGSTSSEIDTATSACENAGGSGCDFDNEYPSREVDLNAFYIHIYEVTESQYFGTGGNIPIVQVSWYEAREYCQRFGMRLPTEEEWEKAARGTGGNTYPWGDTFSPSFLNSYEGGPERRRTVGSYETGKSPYGLYDMAGNVWEWTNSRLHGEMVVRGGSFANYWWFVRSANRGSKPPDDPSKYTGFRCVQDVP